MLNFFKLTVCNALPTRVFPGLACECWLLCIGLATDELYIPAFWSCGLSKLISVCLNVLIGGNACGEF